MSDPTNLYVAFTQPLPPGLDDAALRALFETCGVIESSVLIPNQTYGFVKYASPEEAQAAIGAMDGFNYRGSTVTVRIANSSKGKSKGTTVASHGSNALGSGGPTPPNDSLYIKGLPAGFGDEDVRRIFGAYGEVLQVKIVNASVYHDETIAIVKFGRLEQCAWLVQNVNGNIPQGLVKPVVIRYADPPGTRRSKGAGQEQRYSPYGSGKGGGYDAASLEPAALQALADAINGGASAPPALGGVHDPSSLYVKDLPLHVDDLWLYKVFAPHGAIEKVRAMPRDDGGGCKGIGFVKFVRANEAQTAMSIINGRPTFDGSSIAVAIKTPKRVGGQEGGKDLWAMQSVSGQTPSSVTLAGAAPTFAQADTAFAMQGPGWAPAWDVATSVGQGQWDAPATGQAGWDATTTSAQAQWDVPSAGQAGWDATTASAQTQWDAASAEQASWTAATGQAIAGSVEGSAATMPAGDGIAASVAPTAQPAG